MMIAGIIVLLLGIAMIGGGVASLRGTTTTIRTFSEPQSGEYVSTEIVLNSSSAVVVRSPASTGGLIPSQDLSSVNSGNIGTYALSPTSTAGGSDTYVSLTGDYYYVAFSSSQPSSDVVIAGNLRQTIISGLLVILGFVLAIVGAVLSLVGWRRGRRSGTKKSDSVSDSDYYAKRGDGTQPPTSPPAPS